MQPSENLDTPNRTSVWQGCDARATFIQAFTQEYEKPPWLAAVTIMDGSHRNGNPIAIARTTSGKEYRIKVLRSTRIVNHFRTHHPKVPVIVVIDHFEPAENIRARAFAQIRREADKG
jgi:hypothetical protein